MGQWHKVASEWRRLLRAIRCYVVFDMYLSFTVHTEATIAAGRHAEQQFGEAMKVSNVSTSARLTNVQAGFRFVFAISSTWKKVLIMLKTMVEKKRIGHSQRCTCVCMHSTMSWQKGPQEILTRSQMKVTMGSFDESTNSAQILRMLLRKLVLRLQCPTISCFADD